MNETDYQIQRLRRRSYALELQRDILLVFMNEQAKPFEETTKVERFAFMDRHRKDWPIMYMAEVFEVSAAGFYKWAKKNLC